MPHSELDFSGKTVLVVGGSSGIGNAIAQAFRAKGATVHVWGTRASAADYAESPDSDLSGLHYRQLDVADSAAIAAVDQAGGLLTVMPALGSGTNAQPFETVEDYERWLQRLDGLVVWMDQAIVNLREGAAKGVVQPRAVMEKVLVQLDTMVVPQAQDSQYYAPIQRLPASFSAADRERITAEYTGMLDGKLLPAYQRLRDFVRDDYLPQSRSSVAWTALPDGQAWYDYYVQEHTTTKLTPDEIHALGHSEVKRILGEMDEVRRQVGFKGDLEAFFTFLETDPQFYFSQGPDLLAGYRTLKTQIDAALPKLFSVLPRADYEVREVEAFRAQSAAGAYYQQPHFWPWCGRGRWSAGNRSGLPRPARRWPAASGVP